MCEPFFALLAMFVQHKVRIVSCVGGEYSSVPQSSKSIYFQALVRKKKEGGG